MRIIRSHQSALSIHSYLVHQPLEGDPEGLSWLRKFHCHRQPPYVVVHSVGRSGVPGLPFQGYFVLYSTLPT